MPLCLNKKIKLNTATRRAQRGIYTIVLVDNP